MGAPAADGRAAIFAARLCSVLQVLRRSPLQGGFPLRGGSLCGAALPSCGAALPLAWRRFPSRGGFPLRGGFP